MPSSSHRQPAPVLATRRSSSSRSVAQPALQGAVYALHAYHGVEVRPIDVGVGDWDCTLEGTPPALRLGLRMVKGLSRAAAERITVARPFRDVEDLARRARLNRRDLEALAAADALRGLCGNRHQARWQVLGIEAPLPLGEMPALPEPLPMLRRPTEGEDIAADYGSLGLTLRRHPLALLRPVLTRLSFQSARGVAGLTHGRSAHAAGLVITRQRPGTATGVVFLTLEDETGPLNVIVRKSLFERERRIVLGARLMGVTGEVCVLALDCHGVREGQPPGRMAQQSPDRQGDPPGNIPLLQVMPWPVYGKMTTCDLQAVYEYLRAIPPRQCEESHH